VRTHKVDTLTSRVHDLEITVHHKSDGYEAYFLGEGAAHGLVSVRRKDQSVRNDMRWSAEGVECFGRYLEAYALSNQAAKEAAMRAERVRRGDESFAPPASVLHYAVRMTAADGSGALVNFLFTRRTICLAFTGCADFRDKFVPLKLAPALAGDENTGARFARVVSGLSRAAARLVSQHPGAKLSLERFNHYLPPSA